MEHGEKQLWFDGYQAGAEYALHLYAWHKDGTMYVGSTGRTYEAAKADLYEHVNAMRVAEDVPA